MKATAKLGASVLMILCALACFGRRAEGLYSAREVLEVHQGSFDNADDLHIKFWQKEDSIDVRGWDVGDCNANNPNANFGQPDNEARGNQPPPHDQVDNKRHAVDLDWNNINIPFCTTVRIPFTWWLTEKNTKRVEIFWTKSGEPPAKAVANNGWAVAKPVDIGGGLWRHTVEICNDEDPNDPNAPVLYLTNIKYSSIHHLDPVTTTNLLNWDSWTDAATSEITLQPGECLSFDVNTNFDSDGHVLGSYEAVESLGGLGVLDAGQVITREVFDHPTCEPNLALAYHPRPYDLAEDVPRHVVLSWSPGDYVQDVNAHDVYFGTDFNDVNDANTTVTLGMYKGSQNLDANSYDPCGLLDSNTTYYWRIDEVNGPNRWKGDVWRFKSNDAIVYPNLPVWYEFDEAAPNSVAYDSSGWERDGAVYGPADGWDPNDGRLDGCRVFDDDTSVLVPTDTLDSVSSAISIAVWVKGKTGQTSGKDMSVFDAGDPCEGGEFKLTTLIPSQSGDVVWRAGNDSNDVLVWKDAAPEAWEGYWHHFVFIKDENTGRMRIWFDGLPAVETDVVDATLVNVRGNSFKIGSYNYQEQGYEGRLDDLRVYDRALSADEIVALFRRGDVHLAWAPKPYDGEVDVARDANLSWRPGDYATWHDVYLDTNWDDVNDANTYTAGVYKGSQVPCEYTPPPNLVLDTTYYWRIDEVNDPCTWKGDVWSFTTANYLVVDDMESYNNDNRIYYTWEDFAWNDTGAEVALGVKPVDPVHTGSQSMVYLYDNDSPWAFYEYSAISAYTGGGAYQLQIGLDWTEAGVKALTLYFYGDPNNDANDTEQMYVGLEDGDALYAEIRYGDYMEGEDMNDIKIEEWQEWNIDLDDFTGVDANNVSRVYIGFGDRSNPQPGGLGTVYFDDLRLYRPRCIPSIIKPEADLSGNCIVDMADLRIIADNWLDSVPAEIDLYYDGDMNLKDYAVLADDWLNETLWPPE